MADRKLTAEEKRWQAESDAHTLAESEVIKGDPTRLEAAQKAAEEMAKEQRARADSMSAVAKWKGSQSKADDGA